MKFSTFWVKFGISSVIFTDFWAFGSWTKSLKCYLLFRNNLVNKGLKKELKHLIMPGNAMKWTNSVILEAKTPKMTKLRFAHLYFNPLLATVAIWQQKYRVTFMTSQLKNRCEFCYSPPYLFCRGGNFLHFGSSLGSLTSFLRILRHLEVGWKV